jgi:hypothetical protein
MIEQLPVSNDPLLPVDYARIAPLLDEGYNLSKPLQHYIIAMILFVLLSLSLVDRLIVGYEPSLSSTGFILILIKALTFGMLLYMIDYFLSRNQKQ